MARVLGLKVGEGGKVKRLVGIERVGISDKLAERIALYSGGVGLGLTAVLVFLCILEGLQVVLFSAPALWMTCAGSLLSLISLLFSVRIPRNYQRKVAIALSLIAGLPAWYLLAGVSFTAAVLF